MRCPAHRKETVGTCQWCGKSVCVFCIAKKEGRKLYCDKCSAKLAQIKPIKFPRSETPPIQQKKEIKKEESEKKKFILNKDGYLALEQ